MSEVHLEEPSSPIKTPKQLIIVILAAFLAPIILIVMLSQLVTTGIDTAKTNPALRDEAVAARLKPVGQVEVTDPNAPKIGDKAAWAPRLKTGTEALYAATLKGKGAMPPKGGNLSLGDADVKAAVDYLTGLAR